MPTETRPINILIVDDEKRACANLRNLLINYVDPTLRITGIANNTKEAELKIREFSPDAVFLDIEMPNENAFHFLDRIAPFDFEVIFVTAYDEYAVKAFKLSAVDYILKPISIDELRNAMQKLRDKLKYKNIVKAAATAYTEISNQVDNRHIPSKITLKDANAIEVVDFNDIYFIEADGSYSHILFRKDGRVKEVVMSNPLSEYEEMLPPHMFCRIHRSFLINCAHIQKISADDSNTVTMNNGSVLPVSRRRHASLIEFIRTHNH